MIKDKIVKDIIQAETTRQESNIELIASENFASKDVMAAQGSTLTNKYAEGYPGKRYYCGCEQVDKVEKLAQERVKKLFNCSFANVQPHSGSQANQAVFLALLNPGDTILGMSLDSGGHLTHGAFPNISGKWFNAISYTVDPKTFLIDYDLVESLAIKHKPRMIIAGFSCYSGEIDFAKFRAIADKVGAYLLSDISHIAGIVAAGYLSSPFPHSHVVTSTTHKTLRGPRGGIILTNDAEISQKIDKALFPGLQGGPLMHVIAGKAVAFGEALSNDFKIYIKNVLHNAKILGKTLQTRGYEITTGNTTNHMVVLDLRNHNITGKDAAEALERAGITCNKNAIPFDKTSPFITSGVRIGTAACTTRGFKEKEFITVGNLIADILDGLKEQRGNLEVIEKRVRSQTFSLANDFPIYP